MLYDYEQSDNYDDYDTSADQELTTLLDAFEDLLSLHSQAIDRALTNEGRNIKTALACWIASEHDPFRKRFKRALVLALTGYDLQLPGVPMMIINRPDNS